MSATIRDFSYGRKVFFINPDITLVSEQFLVDFFALGYECYFLESDKTLTFEEKLKIVLSIFPDIILIFNADSVVPGVNLFLLIDEVQKKYGDRVTIGITYVKRANPSVKYDLEKKFNFEMGIKGGCIQLEYNQHANFNILAQALYANQAQGRRKNVRAICNKNYVYSFEKDNFLFSGTLQDISLSHFSFENNSDSLKLEVTDRVQRFQISLNGNLMITPAILIMKRPLENGFLYVFAYLNETGSPGLHVRYANMLKPNIYMLKNTNLNISLIKSYLHSKNSRTPLTLDAVGNELLEMN
ncbi:MAG: hypothetical protein MJ188_02695 [Treponema sp.]|nr:hypothetical protein [Treponema sp.]